VKIKLTKLKLQLSLAIKKCFDTCPGSSMWRRVR
jgi:hypothetical protein